MGRLVLKRILKGTPQHTCALPFCAVGYLFWWGGKDLVPKQFHYFFWNWFQIQPRFVEKSAAIGVEQPRTQKHGKTW